LAEGRHQYIECVLSMNDVQAANFKLSTDVVPSIALLIEASAVTTGCNTGATPAEGIGLACAEP